ncbi:MAG: hypothetical protein DRH08_08850 [Deltaproteobacteria bacterium]|nr:MAG: hypothetical protein DRH08_08850 [Deltaproteobacteria bacterium]
MDEDEPADGILGGPLTQVTEWNIAQYGEGEHADQGDVDFYVQERCLSVTKIVGIAFSLVVSFHESQFFLGIVGTRDAGRGTRKS